MTHYLIEGHAIISADGCYADANGNMPQALRFDEDWRRFQAALDCASLTVLGRKGHEANPKPAARRRLVLSRKPSDRDQDVPGVFWVKPELAKLRAALDRLVPPGGRVAVVGGTGVFDLFAQLGYDTFHLVVAAQVELPGGRALFSGVKSLEDAHTHLRAQGLSVSEHLDIDRRCDVRLVLYSRSKTGDARSRPYG